MNIKTSILAALFVTTLPLVAQAQNAENYDNYKVACESGADCNDFDANYEEADGSSSDKKLYGGGNLGLAFPGDNADVGFGLSGLGGYNFTKNIAAEIEVFDYFGGTDADDLGYNFLGGSANAVYKYAFGSDDKSPYAFGGIGLGIGRVTATGDDAPDDSGESGFLLQGKVGAGYPVTDAVDLTGQLRYFDINIDGDNGDAFAVDAGARFNF
jgi:hypothetical protein